MTLKFPIIDTTDRSDDRVIYWDATASIHKYKDETGGSGLGDHGARVYHNTTQTNADSTTAALAFNSERYDTDAFHDNATNNSRLTVPSGQGGTYLITAHLEWDTNSTGYRSIGIRVNGTDIIAIQRFTSLGGGFATPQSVSTVYNLAVADYVEAIVRQNSGGTRTINNSANYSPEFTLQRIA
jgi:hypothetical protein